MSQLQAIKVLAVEFMRYPDFLIRDLHIPSLTIRSDLKKGSEAVEGFAVMDDHSISLNVSDTLWNRLQDEDWQGRFRSTIHHELYHLMDPTLIQEEQTKEQTKEMYWDWVNLNPAGSAAYGNQPTKAQERPFGFIDSYGNKNVWEDRAMVFEALMMGWNFSADNLSNDTVLAQKVAFIRQQVFHLFTASWTCKSCQTPFLRVWRGSENISVWLYVTWNPFLQRYQTKNTAHGNVTIRTFSGIVMRMMHGEKMHL